MEKKESNTSNREIRLTRLLNAPVELVWEVFTNADHLKHWWGPNGFTNTIHKMDVKPKGEWNQIMHGPDGTDYDNKSVFKEIVKHKKLVYDHVSYPPFEATITFEAQGEKTMLHWYMLFATEELFIQTVKTFKADEGLVQNADRLNAYIQTQFLLRKQLKTSTMARTSTYLNFPGNTEEAFTFYTFVFGTNFNGNGIRRFGDLPAVEGQPPMSDEHKNMVIHVELPILGGHVLMATDAPESMGFKLIQGNNMYINLEPETKKETKQLFDSLSKGGKVTMELQNMFWGAYFGTCTDKYGINWMFNCEEK